MKLNINAELKALIPPLSTDEKAQLEANCLAEGIRDPLVIATYPDDDGNILRILADGHNRYDIAERNGLKFNLTEREFDSFQDIKVWMIDNQKGRRNLTDGWKFELAQVRAEALRAKGREKQSHGMTAPNKTLLSIIDKSVNPAPHNTREELAKDLGWSTGKVAMADKVWKQAEPEIKQQVLAGEKTISAAYQEVRKAEKVDKRKAEIEAVKQKIESEPMPKIGGKYQVLAIDPPWAYGREYDPKSSRVANPYPEMSTADIAKIDLPLAEDSVMFLWTTHAFIQDAFWLLKEWGLTYKAIITWDKERMGMGANIRMQCEFCLLATKGKPILNGSSERDIIREARREHSRKPEAFYKLVERMTIGRRLDYFSREKRQGWDVYGAETEKF